MWAVPENTKTNVFNINHYRPIPINMPCTPSPPNGIPQGTASVFELWRAFRQVRKSILVSLSLFKES